MIDFDQFVFFGQTPTEWFQSYLYNPGVVHWWDVVFTFVRTPISLSRLRPRRRPSGRAIVPFLARSKRLEILVAAGLATQIRLSGQCRRGWPARKGSAERSPPDQCEGLGGTPDSRHRGGALLTTARRWSDQVAAVPSLHSFFVALGVIFLLSRVRPAWRPSGQRSIRWRWASP